jgi:hypothetical protein
MSTPVANPEQVPCAVPPGTPPWITSELIEKTISVWQRFYAMPLTAEDVVEMLMRVSHLMKVNASRCPLLERNVKYVANGSLGVERA